MRFYEFKTLKPQKPLNPEQARIQSLKDQAKRAQAAVKAERARQKMRSAQQSLNQLENFYQPKGPYKALHKLANAYTAWQTVGIYGTFNDALNAVLRKKKTGSVAVRIEKANKVVLYSS
jgi:hypothetical protein